MHHNAHLRQSKTIDAHGDFMNKMMNEQPNIMSHGS